MMKIDSFSSFIVSSFSFVFVSIFWHETCREKIMETTKESHFMAVYIFQTPEETDFFKYRFIRRYVAEVKLTTSGQNGKELFSV